MLFTAWAHRRISVEPYPKLPRRTRGEAPQLGGVATTPPSLRLHSRQWARTLVCAPRVSGRRLQFRHPPLPGATAPWTQREGGQHRTDKIECMWGGPLNPPLALGIEWCRWHDKTPVRADDGYLPRVDNFLKSLQPKRDGLSRIAHEALDPPIGTETPPKYVRGGRVVCTARHTCTARGRGRGPGRLAQ